MTRSEREKDIFDELTGHLDGVREMIGNPARTSPAANPMPQIRSRLDEANVWWLRADDVADALDAAGASVNQRLVAKLRRLR